MTLLFVFPEQEKLGEKLVALAGLEKGKWEWRHFPDGESYVRVDSAVEGKDIALLCSLNKPDSKTLALLFLARTLRELGAKKITLLVPYLGYMRQDTRFRTGEAVTSTLFADMLSPHIDALVTVDPHLHRHPTLETIYRCACTNVTAAPLMAEWIKQQVKKPLIIGPDGESEQWVKQVANAAGSAPYVVLEKMRHGDRKVEISVPQVESYKDHTPVLVDDIISTASTMVKAIGLLREQGYREICCIATHGLFAGDSFARLEETGATRIVTSNSVTHASNAIDIAPLLAGAL